MKAFHKKRAGTASLYVLAALVLISVYSALILGMLKQDIYQMNAYSLQMQAYYLAQEATSATISAMLADDRAALIYTGVFPQDDTMEHWSAPSANEVGIGSVKPLFPGSTQPASEPYVQHYLGSSVISVTKEPHLYYGEMKEWLVIRVTSTIEDTRADRKGQDFTFSTISMVLVDNPVVQIYNIDPDNM